MNLCLCRLLGWATLLTAFTACSEQKFDPSQIRLLREQIEALKETQAQQNRALSSLRTALSTRDESWYKEQQNTSDLRSEIKSTQDQLSALRQEFAAYKDTYRAFIRKAAPGLDLGDLVLNGQLYRSLKIKTLDDAEICFTHAGGFGKTDSLALPVSLREKFVIDADQAESAKLAKLESQKNIAMVDAVSEPDTTAETSAPAYNVQQSVTPVLLSSSQLMGSPPPGAGNSGYSRTNFSQSVLDQKYRRRGVTRSRVNGGARFTGGGGGSC